MKCEGGTAFLASLIVLCGNFRKHSFEDTLDFHVVIILLFLTCYSRGANIPCDVNHSPALPEPDCQYLGFDMYIYDSCLLQVQTSALGMGFKD